ncbi:MSHA biogenesis protein MshF [Vibrio sp. D404a]|uniref:MSHA biogenesis protein MshF n=1 Tax=unclassified Vibrio TaxID=2614977 RepID=UPI0025522AD0|nr:MULTISPECIES: MSHA biogenesis protein MshF [unclassified Vibrio]MDK9737659.1 MSHA biogenesis protein MshF [Vibrio sp. D404a]MDK9797602.1 MSHA biogenesis protein MshF [Vibrio sp. D449a]
MINNLRRSRFVVWSVVILSIIAGLLSMWRSVEAEATNTALIVASKRILERANLYKQQYLLNGHKQVNEDGEPLRYSRTGWLIPIEQTDVNCNYWLDQLYPNGRVLGLGNPKVEDLSDNARYRCRYQYTEKHQIEILLKGERFSVKANILA